MSAWGAFIGLLVSIFLIIRKVSPVYSLILGALVGGLLGGVSLPETISLMISGVNDVTPAVIRILTAGVLSGILVKTGAAASISNTIIYRLGERHVFFALAFATMLLTAIGVFIDVAVITVAPIALSIGRKLAVPRGSLLLMMIGGGKCGNIISPNPNTIIAAENFHADLYSVMYANLIPALVGLLFTVYVIGRFLPRQNGFYANEEIDNLQADLPSFASSMVAPVVTIPPLSFRPLFHVAIDPMIALPVGGIVGILAMRKWSLITDSLSYGLKKMSNVSILLVGTGTIAGVIKASSIKDVLLDALSHTNMGELLLAPVSPPPASTPAGATVASSSFADIIIAAGISGVWGAAMINSGATVLDHLPHGSFFHATGGVADISLRERLRLIPYETAIGAILAVGAIIAYRELILFVIRLSVFVLELFPSVLVYLGFTVIQIAFSQHGLSGLRYVSKEWLQRIGTYMKWQSLAC